MMEDDEMNRIEAIRECFLAKARQHLLPGAAENGHTRHAAGASEDKVFTQADACQRSLH